MRRWIIGLLLPLFLAAGVTLPAWAAESLQLVEQQIQAGLLYNFLKATKWPLAPNDTPDAPMVVCLFGGDPFNGHLGPMAGRTVNQRRIEIRNIGRIEDAQVCALLVIHPAEKPHWPQLRAALAGQAILTVSGFDGFAQTGGMIELTHIDQKIGMRLNPDALAAAHLEVEDRLVRLAMVVRGGADAR